MFGDPVSSRLAFARGILSDGLYNHRGTPTLFSQPPAESLSVSMKKNYVQSAAPGKVSSGLN